MKNKALWGIALFTFLVSMAYGQSDKEIRKNKIKSVTTWQSDKDDNPPVAYKDTYELYDKAGNLVAKTQYKKDGSVDWKETYLWDKYQNKTEELHYRGESVLQKKMSWKYNAKNQRIEEKEFEGNGTLKRVTSYQYNADEERSLETVKDAQGTQIKTIEYKYGSKGLKTEKVTRNRLNKPESIKKWAYEYY